MIATETAGSHNAATALPTHLMLIWYSPLVRRPRSDLAVVAWGVGMLLRLLLFVKALGFSPQPLQEFLGLDAERVRVAVSIAPWAAG
jgi:hypothetical protein